MFGTGPMLTTDRLVVRSVDVHTSSPRSDTGCGRICSGDHSGTDIVVNAYVNDGITAIERPESFKQLSSGLQSCFFLTLQINMIVNGSS